MGQHIATWDCGSVDLDMYKVATDTKAILLSGGLALDRPGARYSLRFVDYEKPVLNGPPGPIFQAWANKVGRAAPQQRR